MMGVTKAVHGMIATASLLAGLVLTAAPARAVSPDGVQAASCYGSFGFFGSNGQTAPGGGRFFRTTTNCLDINIKANEGGYVLVCFRNAGCQSSFKQIVRGQWIVVATNVRDNVDFYFYFNTAGPHSGTWAA